MSPGKSQRPGGESQALSNRVTAVSHQSSGEQGQRRGRRLRAAVTIESRMAAYISGPFTREVITELRGRPPVWSSVARAHCVTEETARDVIAVLERRGYEVEVESYQVVQVAPQVVAAGPAEQPDPGRGLW